MLRIVLLSSVAILLSLTSCRKSTQSDFELLRTEYRAGEEIKYKVLKKRRNQVWTIERPGPPWLVKRYDTVSPKVRIPLTLEDGVYTLNVYDSDLEYDENVKKSEEFVVKSQRAELSVSGSSSGSSTFQVWLDLENIGSLQNGGSLERNIPLGLYFIRIYNESGTLIKSGTINLENAGTTYPYSF